jgi:hypothetical protein
MLSKKKSIELILFIYLLHRVFGYQLNVHLPSRRHLCDGERHGPKCSNDAIPVLDRLNRQNDDHRRTFRQPVKRIDSKSAITGYNYSSVAVVFDQFQVA